MTSRCTNYDPLIPFELESVETNYRFESTLNRAEADHDDALRLDLRSQPVNTTPICEQQPPVMMYVCT